ncbi:MAG: hypothetical protein NC400_09160 [Clostridium sp.]|nr:hypothetical protein [Clostridium sp.]
MSYTKKKLEELNVIDDFLMNRLASDSAIGEEFCRILLSTLLQRKIGKVNVTVQKVISPLAPDRKGIRLDVKVEEPAEPWADGKTAAMNIYDIEPHLLEDTDIPKRNRFYQALIDSSQMKSGEKDYKQLPDLYILMILDKDPFGYDYMTYTIRNKCEEITELEYKDGLWFYYFFTKGNKGGNEAVKTMLRYIGDSRKENAVDSATKKLHRFAESVKMQPEVRRSYMFWEEYVSGLKKVGKVEGALEILLDLLSDYGEIPEETAKVLYEEKRLDTLRKWVKLATKVKSMDEFVAGM